jgi:hypothetical protein
MMKKNQIIKIVKLKIQYKEVATSNQVTGIKKNNAGTIVAVAVLNLLLRISKDATQ